MYKRQEFKIKTSITATEAAALELAISEVDPAALAALDAAGTVLMVSTVIGDEALLAMLNQAAVSYTHLDVYKRQMKPLVIRSALVASLGGLIFGFDTAVISGTTDSLKRVFELDDGGLGFTVTTALLLSLIHI